MRVLLLSMIIQAVLTRTGMNNTPMKLSTVAEVTVAMTTAKAGCLKELHFTFTGELGGYSRDRVVKSCSGLVGTAF